MSRSRLLPLVLLAVVACDANGPLAPEVDLDPQVEQFLSLLNAHRADVGCSVLTWNGAVAEVAQAHSVDMATRSFFSHINPDGDTPFDRLSEAGVAFSSAGENIAHGYATAEAVLAGWLNSPGHRANIENCSFTHHGVGLVDGRWTHLFLQNPTS